MNAKTCFIFLNLFSDICEQSSLKALPIELVIQINDFDYNYGYLCLS